MNSPMTFIFLGKSGAGKGTQADLLKRFLEENKNTSESPIFALESGKRFREFMTGPSATAVKVKEFIDHGRLLPAFLSIWNWTGAFIENLKGDEHLIMDGICRRLIEAQAMDDALQFYGRVDQTYIIYLTVKDEAATDRLHKRLRYDDNEEEIKKRLAWFGADVIPVIEHFKSSGKYKFIEIDGEQSIEEVHEMIKKSIWSV